MLSKALLMSMMIATVVIPVIASKAKTRAQGVRKTVTWTMLFCVFYMLALLHVYPRLGGN